MSSNLNVIDVKRRPYFSVITVVHNRAESISRCIESVLAQSFCDFEYHIIDAVSDDGTSDIIASYKLVDGRISHVRESDTGIYNAINKGIKKSLGKYICLVHSDDLFPTDDILTRVYTRTKDQLPDLYSGRAAYFNKDVSQITRIYPNVKFSRSNLEAAMMPNHTALYVRATLYDKVGLYSEQFQIASDFDFLCRLMKHGEVSVVEDTEILSLMQVGGASTAGLKSMITLNLEVLNIAKFYDLKLSVWTIIKKYCKKVCELKIL